MARKKLTVRRKGYYKDVKRGPGYKRGYIPPATFKIEDRGAPGRGKKVLPKLKKGALGGPGFFDKPARMRRKVAARLAKKHGEKSVVGRLRAIQVLNKRQNPKVAAKARADSKYIAGSFRGKRQVRYPGGFGRSRDKLREVA